MYVVCVSGENHAEIQLRSNMNADTVALSFYTEACKEFVGVLLEDAMDQRVVSTDLKLRHIVNKAVEVTVKNFKFFFPLTQLLALLN